MESIARDASSLIETFAQVDAALRGAWATASIAPDGTLLSANETLFNWLGLTPAETLGRLSLTQWLRSAKIAFCVRSGVSGSAEAEVLRRNDAKLPALFAIVPVHDAAGNYVLSRAAIVEIQLRKQAEVRLRDSEANMARAQALTHFGHYEAEVGLTDPGLNWSEEFFRILGLDPAQGPLSTEHFLARCVYAEDRDRVLRFIEDCVTNERSGVLEYRIVTADGSLRHLRDVVQFVPRGEGKSKRFFGVVQDITELSRTQEQLRQLTQHLLEVRETERENLARELHDELGSILTAARMYLADAAENSTNTARLDFPLRKALALLDQGLSATRRITTDLRPSVLDHRGLLGGVDWLAENLASSAGITCNIDIDPMTVDQLDSGAVRVGLFRITQEAMRNAVRHADASRITVRAQRLGGYLQLEIEDNGKGVTVEQLGKPGCAGVLGMRERARALGGDFSLNSQPGRGTSVIVRLPITGAPAHPALEPRA